MNDNQKAAAAATEAEAAAAATAEAAAEAETLAAAKLIVSAAAVVAPTPPTAEELTEVKLATKFNAGQKMLLSGVLANQHNPLTNQCITHGAPVIVEYDRWVEIQLAAGVLFQHEM